MKSLGFSLACCCRWQPTVRAEGLPLIAPPPPETEQPLPTLQPGRPCPALAEAIRADVGAEARVWSVTVLNSDGDILGDVTGAVPRIPASYQMLISTAFALDRLGPDFRLKTRLIQRPDGSLELNGEGDPDLGIAGLQRFAMAALRQGGSMGGSPQDVKLMVREEPRANWWPADWHPADRGYAYGAPITRLALTSNAVGGAVSDPYNRLQVLFRKGFTRGGSVSIEKGQPMAEPCQWMTTTAWFCQRPRTCALLGATRKATTSPQKC